MGNRQSNRAKRTRVLEDFAAYQQLNRPYFMDRLNYQNQPFADSYVKPFDYHPARAGYLNAPPTCPLDASIAATNARQRRILMKEARRYSEGLMNQLMTVQPRQLQYDGSGSSLSAHSIHQPDGHLYSAPRASTSSSSLFNAESGARTSDAFAVAGNRDQIELSALDRPTTRRSTLDGGAVTTKATKLRAHPPQRRWRRSNGGRLISIETSQRDSALHAVASQSAVSQEDDDDDDDDRHHGHQKINALGRARRSRALGRLAQAREQAAVSRRRSSRRWRELDTEDPRLSQRRRRRGTEPASNRTDNISYSRQQVDEVEAARRAGSASDSDRAAAAAARQAQPAPEQARRMAPATLDEAPLSRRVPNLAETMVSSSDDAELASESAGVDLGRRRGGNHDDDGGGGGGANARGFAKADFIRRETTSAREAAPGLPQQASQPSPGERLQAAGADSKRLPSHTSQVSSAGVAADGDTRAAPLENEHAPHREKQNKGERRRPPVKREEDEAVHDQGEDEQTTQVKSGESESESEDEDADSGGAGAGAGAGAGVGPKKDEGRPRTRSGTDDDSGQSPDGSLGVLKPLQHRATPAKALPSSEASPRSSSRSSGVATAPGSAASASTSASASASASASDLAAVAAAAGAAAAVAKKPPMALEGAMPTASAAVSAAISAARASGSGGRRLAAQAKKTAAAAPVKGKSSQLPHHSTSQRPPEPAETTTTAAAAAAALVAPKRATAAATALQAGSAETSALTLPSPSADNLTNAALDAAPKPQHLEAGAGAAAAPPSANNSNLFKLQIRPVGALHKNPAAAGKNHYYDFQRQLTRLPTQATLNPTLARQSVNSKNIPSDNTAASRLLQSQQSSYCTISNASFSGRPAASGASSSVFPYFVTKVGGAIPISATRNLANLQNNNQRPNTNHKSNRTPAPAAGLQEYPDQLTMASIPSRVQQGLAFGDEQRRKLGLVGHLPAAKQSQELQIQAVIKYLDNCQDELAKYVHLRNLKDYNERLFYATLMANVEKLMPLVYTPTVGLACQRFSETFMRPRGLFVTANDAGRVNEVLANWAERNVRVIVVTDGERILGLGDLGANGMGICIGKLSLYTALAGIPPRNVLPITVDVGTNNEGYLNDPIYIGLRQKRLRGAPYEALIDELMAAIVQRWGSSCLIQFEDFGNSTAFSFLQRYRDRYCTFNDDIQGTASVCLSGLLSAARLIGRRMADCSFLFYGAGEANLGTAKLLCMAMQEEGVDEKRARESIWLVDSKGLVVTDRDDLSSHKREFARPGPKLKNLEEIIAHTKPAGIIGASAQGGAFTEGVCRKMAELNERPIIFALSNPTSKAECTANQAYEWTDGRCVFASGSPFDPVKYGGKSYVTGQGNNAYIFPAVGLAAIAAHVHNIPEETFLVAAKSLSDQVTKSETDVGLVYPRLNRIRDVTLKIACRVLEYFYAERLATYRPEPVDKESFLRSIQYDVRYEAPDSDDDATAACKLNSLAANGATANPAKQNGSAH